tara:strand:- start:124 stop:306 length:183 start_codon:yes stop_codon:yes gene_type:complete
MKMANLLQKFVNLFKKEEPEHKRLERWDKDNTEIQRLNDLHEKARKPYKRKKSKPVTYSL